MRKVFTIADIQNSPVAHLNPHVTDKQVGVPTGQPRPKKGSKTKEWVHQVLKAFAAANGLLFLAEYQFDLEGGRKWRTDWALLKNGQPLAAIEYEGIHSEKSRHTTKIGYVNDTEKYNQASLQGFKLLRYTANNAMKSLSDDLTKLKV